MTVYIYWWEIPVSFGAHPHERMANYKRHLSIEAEVQARLAEERRKDGPAYTDRKSNP